MAWPQTIYLGLLGLTVVAHVSKHGEQREPYNGPVQFINACLSFALLYWGGFWKPLFGGGQ